MIFLCCSAAPLPPKPPAMPAPPLHPKARVRGTSSSVPIVQLFWFRLWLQHWSIVAALAAAFHWVLPCSPTRCILQLRKPVDRCAVTAGYLWWAEPPVMVGSPASYVSRQYVPKQRVNPTNRIMVYTTALYR